MRNRNGSNTATVGVLVLLLFGAATNGMGQTRPTPAGQTSRRQTNMAPLESLPGGSHHAQVLAYRDTLATLARTLEGQVRGAKTVNLDLVRPEVAEMRRRLDQILEHHQAQITMIGDQAKPPRMQHLETRLAELGEDLTDLESEMSGATPDPRKVAARAAEIVRHCAALSAMPVDAKPRVARKTP